MEKIRLGIIGVGSVVREIYQYLYYHSQYTRLLDIVAVADPNEQYRNWFCDTYGIGAERRFSDYQQLLENEQLDAVHVNTPDHLHAAPAIAALNAGLDVVVPKPTASTVPDAHAMIQAAQDADRILGVDFHKREDPRIRQCEARYQSGRYGRLQSSVWYMLDKLRVADPNADPPFFASPDFAETNSPISFLTVHMCDALMQITRLLPIRVRATGFSHKLPTLAPRPVQGFDLCDTEIAFDNGAVAHIITGWHLPNTAHATAVQSSRLICSEGMIDLQLDRPGYHELHEEGIAEVNPLFLNFQPDGTVSGYGISSPGRLFERIWARRAGQLSDQQKAQLMNPIELGFFTTLVCQAAEQSLREGIPVTRGVTEGRVIDLRQLCAQQLGEPACEQYLPSADTRDL
jgi:predicted dehydrogenase